MLIITEGYPIKFIQTHPVKDNSCHLKSYVFKFFSTNLKLHYIVRAEYHKYDFFAIKFYAKKDRGSDRKYFNILNKGDVANILVTCAKVIPLILQKFPNASFGFIGSRTIDINSNKIESYTNNQRYRIYKHHLPQLIGLETFQHISYQTASSYGLINKNIEDISKHESLIKAMIINTYNDILEID
ncbi:MAG: hypothetical protein CMC70_07480 [Flavobacteriaceae bacterium]|nr:hypothetical protein [Flavobacteriaceae bacterium]